MSSATREIQYYINNSKETQSKGIILSPSTDIQDAQKCEAGVPKTTPVSGI